VSDIDTVVVDSLKVLDLKWPIREAVIGKVTANSGVRDFYLDRFGRQN